MVKKKWSESVDAFEATTVDLVEIGEHFLTQFFGCAPERAEEIMAEFLRTGVWDEDMISHESDPYRLAAVAHFLCEMRRPFGELGAYLMNTESPAEARDYVQKNFWDKYRPA